MCLIGDAKCVNAGDQLRNLLKTWFFYRNFLRKIKNVRNVKISFNVKCYLV